MNVSFQGIQIKTYNPLRVPCFRRLVLSSFYDPFSLYPTGHKLTRTRTDGTDGCRPTDRSLCCVGAGRRHLPLGTQHPEPQHPASVPRAASAPRERGRPTRQKGKGGLQSSRSYGKITHNLTLSAQGDVRDLGGHLENQC